jgi:hypothetical protein
MKEGREFSRVDVSSAERTNQMALDFSFLSHALVLDESYIQSNASVPETIDIARDISRQQSDGKSKTI